MGSVPLNALPKDTTSALSGLFSIISPKCRALSRKAGIPFFKVFWYDSIRGKNPRSTDCEADALNVTPSRRSAIKISISNGVQARGQIETVLKWRTGGYLRLFARHYDVISLVIGTDRNLNFGKRRRVAVPSSFPGHTANPVSEIS